MKNLISDIYNIDERIIELGKKAEENCREAFRRIEQIAEYNGAKGT